MSVRVSDQGRVRPVMTLSGFLGGSVESGPSGQVPTANGSNGVAWGSNVAIITSNGSNALLGPYVNFSAGSNILFTLDVGPFPGQAYPSNTLRIHVHPDITSMLSFVGAKAYNSAVQVISNATETPLLLDSEEFDTDGFHSTSVTTSRFTIPPGKGGKYRITAGGQCPTAGSPEFLIRKNGTTYLRGGSVGAASAQQYQNTTTIEDLVAGDYVEAVAYQASGGDQNYGHASVLQSQITMSIERIGL